MIVINSGAYVNQEFRNELGAIPPCFLPLGNKKLLQHQVESLAQFTTETIVVSLPESYELSLDERALVQSLGLKVVVVPDNFTLGEAITYVLNVSASNDQGVRLLHGDTLIWDLPNDSDILTVGHTIDEYNWEIENTDSDDDTLVWSGFFSFSSQKTFLKALSLCRGNFVEAVRAYSEDFALKTYSSEHWFDLGHINTYFSSRSKITTQRSFNDLRIETGLVYKTGYPTVKIEAEEKWFKSVPFEIKKYTPHLIDSGCLRMGGGFMY